MPNLQEDFVVVKGESTAALHSTASPCSAAKMCSECYVNQSFVNDDGTVINQNPRVLLRV